MARRDYIFTVLLGAVYVVLIGPFASLAVTWVDPLSSDNSWGQSSVTAIAYMQIYHSIGVALAALPIALAIVWRYKANWVYSAAVTAIVGSLYMLFDHVRGARLASQAGLSQNPYYIVSGLIDVLKTGLILIFLAAVVRMVLVPTKRTADHSGIHGQ